MDIEERVISATVNFVKGHLSGAEGGHDWWHIERVWKLAKRIAAEEKANIFIVELAALLHDVSDSKFNGGDYNAGPELAESFLIKQGVDLCIVNHVKQIVANVSFKGGNAEKTFHSKELDIVQDADRLDAIGAIGIARAFNYGGFKNREMYNPGIPPVLNMTPDEYKKNQGPTLNHFYEKLLLLKDRMKTGTGRRIAEERHKFLLIYLERFKREWDGNS